MDFAKAAMDLMNDLSFIAPEDLETQTIKCKRALIKAYDMGRLDERDAAMTGRGEDEK